MEIVRVAKESEVEEFVQFPFKLYYREYNEREPLWVPSMISEVKSALNPEEHPFYENPESDAQCFLAKANGKVAGRVMALESAPHNEEHQDSAAFFYFFESRKNQQVADRLLGAASDWARNRNLKTIMGPRGMLAGQGHGILVEGFDQRPGMGMAWNPPYYKELVEEAGFEKLTDSLSARVPLDFVANQEKVQRLYKGAERVEERYDFEVKTFNNKQEIERKMDWLAPQLCKLFNESFSDLPLYQPMSEEKMRRVINNLLPAVDSWSIKLIKLVVKDNEIIGFFLAYPNIVPALRRARGKLLPLGWLDLALSRRLTTWADANGIGVLPEYRSKGVTALLYAELLKTLQESRFRNLIVNQVGEKNHRNIREMKKTFGIEFDRTHRIYFKGI